MWYCARDPQKLALAKHAVEDMLEPVPRARSIALAPSHGENRGSSPLGSANDFSLLVPKWSLVPAGISNFSPMDGASDNQFEIGAVTAEPA